ncbi:YopX family protein [Desulfosporosinus youngiae]|uniref:YopX protein n=1 Tax=Desulfosporosinus youngiae DSM 17734 TaxID=768710 RepID=H5Y261_9FIRM|nr:YopX family protein [Desulfosporosinus youngiae]EHQ88259.1 YopX protein [Desulfosporosinus youngiae DSM 17734]
MSREIKFKAYIKSLKWLVPVERICFDCETVEVDLTDGNGDTAEYEFDEIELMRYTGLKDNNIGHDRKEIFEGDRVKATNKNGWTREFEIIWNEDLARFMVWCGSQPNISFDLTCDTIIDFRVVVIGNIHDKEVVLEKPTCL